MTVRKDIRDGLVEKNLKENFGLIYTCNCGWIDLGHLNPENPRPEIGAANLWKHIKEEGPAVLKSECRGWFTANDCKKDPYYRFQNGKTGFLVRYRQDNKAWKFHPGAESTYIVQHELSKPEKERVALTIFTEVSVAFESFQEFASVGERFTKSGFSQDDLVSNLIGFYIGIGKLDRMSILKKCHPVSKESAWAIWDRDGEVGKNKNKEWRPRFARDVVAVTDKACEVECLNAAKKFPAELEVIQPALEGRWHILFNPSGSGDRPPT